VTALLLHEINNMYKKARKHTTQKTTNRNRRRVGDKTLTVPQNTKPSPVGLTLSGERHCVASPTTKPFGAWKEGGTRERARLEAQEEKQKRKKESERETEKKKQKEQEKDIHHRLLALL
jgi:hypothetical protein